MSHATHVEIHIHVYVHVHPMSSGLHGIDPRAVADATDTLRESADELKASVDAAPSS